jgi:hypothetical protein
VARGNIKQRSKGSWFIRVELESDPTTGKRRQKAETFVGNKRDAEARMNELLGNVRQGITGKAGRTTVAEFLERWLRDHAEANLAPRTSLRYANLLRTHVVPGGGLAVIDTHHVAGGTEGFFADAQACYDPIRLHAEDLTGVVAGPPLDLAAVHDDGAVGLEREQGVRPAPAAARPGQRAGSKPAS